MSDRIKIMEYDPNWIKAFELEKSCISSLLGEEAITIEHIGSTSIPNQDAKPIVDIFIGVSPFKELAFYKSVFDSVSYNYIKTGMRGRYLFSKCTDGTWTHNIHVLPFNDEFYTRKEFLFRNYLREHPDLVQEYGEIKKKLAKSYGKTMEEYTRSKTDFIQKVVDAARTEKGLPLQNVWED
ncbi:GrpB family protein [Pseudalkalibacillus salsuginis]|uniref:GrpB family protein n=1 Tax=Pseudalkalibacillus salsuginis TaxID=2910972 RepID=UPI001F1D40BD|nr:GrpB family protein [Pseudalkalibacillus salsuginis]MCF6409743.1 GrpB family protein [Pseudalkalibacillus salsuginis]